MTSRLYIAGPMTGMPDLNYPAFQRAEERLKEVGYEVRNPANIDVIHALPAEDQGCEWCYHQSKHPWNWYMKKAIIMMLECDGIVMLNGWTRSTGAMIEHDLAGKLKMPRHSMLYWTWQGEPV